MRKNLLSPSILAADFRHLEQDIQAAVGAGAEYLHIDVIDGQFAPSISFGMPVIECIRKSADCVFDVHLMITEPDRYLETFAKCGADSITVHAEACTHLHSTIQQIKALDLRAAVALNPATPLAALDYVIEDVDMILIMTVNPGFGGQKLIPQTIRKVAELRKRLTELGLETDIEVDGGINQQTVAAALEAGANVIVAGSAVFKDDIAANVKSMKAIMDQYTVW